MDRIRTTDIFEEHSDFGADEMIASWGELEDLEGLDLGRERLTPYLREEQLNS